MKSVVLARLSLRGIRLRWLVSLISLASLHAASLPLDYSSSALPTYNYREYPAGSSLTLRLSGSIAANAGLQWFHDDQPIPNATTLSLVLPSLSSNDAGNYRIRVTDGTSVSYSDTFTVNVLPAATAVVDPTFTSQLPADYAVASVTAFASDGSFIVQNSGTAPAAPIRLATDGSLVSSFSYPTSAGAVLAGFPDGRLITSNAPYLLTANGGAAAFTLPAGFDPTKPLSGAAVSSDGKFYLSQGTTIVRFLADGAVDLGFSFSTALDTSSTVYTVDPQGRLYVRGRRVDPNPYNFPSSWDVFYRLTLDGHFDFEFDESTGLFRYGSARVKIVPLADGRTFHWSAYHGYYSWLMLDDHGVQIAGWSGGLFTDYTVSVDPERAYVYVPQSSSLLKRYKLTATGLSEDTDFFPGVTASSSWPPFVIAPDGKLLLFTQSPSWEGHVTQNLARIRTDVPLPLLPPVVAVLESSYLPTRGSTLTVTGQVSGDGPYTYQWLALDGQPLPTDTISPSLVLPNFSAANFGRYQLRVNGAFGTELSAIVELGLSDSSVPYLANLSGRAVPGSGEDTTIAGVTTKVYAGALGVPLLIRGVGPGLKNLGVTNFLPNPALNLLDLTGAVVGNNDNWNASVDRDAIRTEAATTGAFAFAENSLDAALLKTSYNQQYTVNLFDQSNATGVGLLEIYRVPDDLVVGELTNISLRARTASGESTAIAGFVIVDPQNFDRSARVLLRVVGPTLAAQGIQHPLENPLLTVFNAKGEIVAFNDDWAVNNTSAEATTLATAMKQVGAFGLPATSKDSALLLDLPAGAYTMHATGGTGVVLLEIYLVR